MKLRSVTLDNFKCFQKIKVELHPRLTVLVGGNGAGKTAILDGIAVGLSPILAHLSSPNQRLVGRAILDTDFRLERWTDRGGKEKWGSADVTQISVETTNGLAWDHWKASVKKARPEHSAGQQQLSDYVARLQGSYKTQAPELTPVVAYYGAQRGYIKVPGRLHESSHHYDYPASGLIGALNSTSDFKELLKWFDQAEATELRANKGIATDRFKSTAELSAAREAIHQLLGGRFENPHFNVDHKFVLQPVGGAYVMQVTQLSQGYQSMLALGMDFARRLALSNPHLNYLDTDQKVKWFEEIERWWPSTDDATMPDAAPLLAPAIMLVDEIDLHLHPRWQQRVLHDLMRTFPNTQFIVTTHSPQVLTTVDAECIRLLVDEPDVQTGLARMVIHSTTFQTKGVASADALLEIMDTNPVPPELEAQWLEDYETLIQEGMADSKEALSLRIQLDKHFGFEHPSILNCDRLIRLQGYKRRAASQATGE